MSAAKIITCMGATVALVGGKVKLSGLDRLPAEVAARVLTVAREHRDELRRELDCTGLGWLPGPPADEITFDGWWAAFDLADLSRLYGLRIVLAGGRIFPIFPPALDPELVTYACTLLAEAQAYLAMYLDKLPALSPDDAVQALKGIMCRNKELKFCRGHAGGRWPVYPKHWESGQKANVQRLWLAAGPALDAESFEGVPP